MRGSRYDHLIFEASGVAEPKLLRAMFQVASASQSPPLCKQHTQKESHSFCVFGPAYLHFIITFD